MINEFSFKQTTNQISSKEIWYWKS